MRAFVVEFTFTFLRHNGRLRHLPEYKETFRWSPRNERKLKSNLETFANFLISFRIAFTCERLASREILLFFVQCCCIISDRKAQQREKNFVVVMIGVQCEWNVEHGNRSISTWLGQLDEKIFRLYLPFVLLYSYQLLANCSLSKICYILITQLFHFVFLLIASSRSWNEFPSDYDNLFLISGSFYRYFVNLTLKFRRITMMTV